MLLVTKVGDKTDMAKCQLGEKYMYTHLMILLRFLSS